MKYEFIAVDVQNEFVSKGGKFYSSKPSIIFLKKVLFPFLKEKNIKINEIISDYRQPRPGDDGDGCYPGTWGYQSLIHNELKKSIWVKSMNSPIWVRKNIGSPEKTIPVIFGLTIDCCVLSVVQEFRWRGYKPIVIKEAVDHASGKEQDKNAVLNKTAIKWWARTMEWNEFKKEFN